MSPPTPDPDHDDLDRILEVVDGPRELPPGAEDRLLAAVLETASASRLAAHPTRPRPRSRRLNVRWWSPGFAVGVLTTAVITALIIGVALTAAQPPAPTILGGPPTASLDDVNDAALCSNASDLIATLRLDQAGLQADSDIASLRELAVVLDEFASRIDGDALIPTGDIDETLDRAEIAAATLRMQARHLEAGDTDAAVRARVRSASVLLDQPPVVETLGCTSSGA